MTILRKNCRLNNRNGCNNVIEITNAISNDLPKGTTITFAYNMDDSEFELGEIVVFNITSYKEWVGPSTADCFWPQYAGVISFIE